MTTFHTPLSDFHLAVICGGPSPERGISLNSARSLLDHLHHAPIYVQPFYVDTHKQFYRISPAQLYSNTPADFDFKLHNTATQLSEQEAVYALSQCNMIFPAIHGKFGEDGDLPAWLAHHHLPFVGPNEWTCKQMFWKNQAAQRLRAHGFDTLESLQLSIDTPEPLEKIQQFMHTHACTRVVVKPIAGGSSIGVHSANTPQQALAGLEDIFARKLGQYALIEPFCSGREFTVIVLQNQQGEAVALIPSEIEISGDQDKIYDYRRKYLATTQTSRHCPPRFPPNIIEKIRSQAETIFRLFDACDFARFDGWWLEDQRLIFTDFNPISGMEQNSFLFQQAARIGLDHQTVLHYILTQACHRQKCAPPNPITSTSGTLPQSRTPVNVLFGGDTAERQVSLMSGSNVYLKLQHSKQYAPTPCFLDKNNIVWLLPLVTLLHHTVEEIQTECEQAGKQDTPSTLARTIHDHLFSHNKKHPPLLSPQPLTWEKFILLSQQQKAFIFLALHGGNGENGTIQTKLDIAGLCYNGSGPESAAWCMDKCKTGALILAHDLPNIQSSPKQPVNLQEISNMPSPQCESWWAQCTQSLDNDRLVIKPHSDGCSAGIVVLSTSQELQLYAQLITAHATHIPAHTFCNQPQEISLSSTLTPLYFLEPYIERDLILLDQNRITLEEISGWIELTVGVLAHNNHYHALAPSITIASQQVLSLEEKFQGGTGINITPPPETLLSTQQCKQVQSDIETVARLLKIDNYARIDCFFHRTHNITLIIEANTLPGLTPATVIYHQALCESPALYPIDLLEKIIETKQATHDTTPTSPDPENIATT